MLLLEVVDHVPQVVAVVRAVAQREAQDIRLLEVRVDDRLHLVESLVDVAAGASDVRKGRHQELRVSGLVHVAVRRTVRRIWRAERPAGAGAGGGVDNNADVLQGAEVVGFEVAIGGAERGGLDRELLQDILPDSDQVASCDRVAGACVEREVKSSLVPRGDAMQVLVVVELHVLKWIVLCDAEKPGEWYAILLACRDDLLHVTPALRRADAVHAYGNSGFGHRSNPSLSSTRINVFLAHLSIHLTIAIHP